MRQTHPELILDVIGAGWWDEQLKTYASDRGVADRVMFHGFVDDQTKHELLAQSWLMALPSLKEGWGIVVGEAGAHSTPTIAYSTAGGTTESIDHKDSGILVDTGEEFTAAARQLIDDAQWREFLGQGALAKSQTYSWVHSRREFGYVLTRASA